MSLPEGWHPHIVYHHGMGSGSDVAAHQQDHYILVKQDAVRLSKMTVREKRKYRPTLRQHIRFLMDTSSATGGDAIVHRDTATDQINRHLPPYLHISARHVQYLP